MTSSKINTYHINPTEDYPQFLIELIQSIEWKAGPHLAQRVKDNNLASYDEIIVLTTLDDQLIGFGAYLETDILDKADYPFGPFVSTIYVTPKYRGQGISYQLINNLLQVAKKNKREQLYVVTEHTGLYEKNGFIFQGFVTDIFNRKMRLLKKDL
ncbi:GNAT family N-acetyltransferase [Streptococcus porcinus]|uniref:GNAT family N-acetyltransferase n=1 Tax=Streptococcus porcinus TaxID=1340 RepID=A0A7V9WR78_STRPO|nr:GNAT family N-acetyltransferase [Streptococcus porcinus]MBA2795607.1 GNAT family N-acetyltransferase [Streptococcus porcinus]